MPQALKARRPGGIVLDHLTGQQHDALLGRGQLDGLRLDAVPSSVLEWLLAPAMLDRLNINFSNHLQKEFP